MKKILLASAAAALLNTSAAAQEQQGADTAKTPDQRRYELTIAPTLTTYLGAGAINEGGLRVGPRAQIESDHFRAGFEAGVDLPIVVIDPYNRRSVPGLYAAADLALLLGKSGFGVGVKSIVSSGEGKDADGNATPLASSSLGFVKLPNDVSVAGGGMITFEKGPVVVQVYYVLNNSVLLASSRHGGEVGAGVSYCF